MIASLTHFRLRWNETMARWVRTEATPTWRVGGAAHLTDRTALSKRYARSRVASSGERESKVTSLFNDLHAP